jgi:transmembrane sensor
MMKSGFELTPDGIGAPSRSEAEVRKEAIAWYARLCSGDATEADRENWARCPRCRRGGSCSRAG